MSWATTRPRRALDLDFTVAADEPALVRYLDAAYADLPPADAPAARFELRQDGLGGYVVTDSAGTPWEASDASTALVQLVSVVNRAVVEATSPAAILLHAAGVESDGGCLVLPASPTAGKSTLAAGLVRRGWRYLSDEVVALDPVTGHARAYPRPVTLKPGSWPLFPDLRPAVTGEAQPFLGLRWLVAPRSLGTGPCGSGGPVTVLTFPEFVAGATSRIRSCSKVDALQVLAGSCFNLDRWGAAGFELLADVVRSADCAELIIDDLDEACDALEARCSTLERR